jgi:hypothetical protein
MQHPSSSPILDRIHDTLEHHSVDSVDAPGYSDAVRDLDDLIGENVTERQNTLRELYLYVQHRAQQSVSVAPEADGGHPAVPDRLAA